MCRSGNHWSNILIFGKCHVCNKELAPIEEKKTVDLENMQVDGLNAEEGFKVCAGLNFEKTIKQLEAAGFTNIPLGYNNEGNPHNPF